MERARRIARGVVRAMGSTARPGFPETRDETTPTVAIVGAGFSGALLAVQLTRQAVGRLNIALIDRAGSRGQGLAYSAQNPHHLLNVRVENMSALPEHPNHFRDWLERRTGLKADGLAFVSRGLYGAYIEEILATAVKSASGRVSINSGYSGLHRHPPQRRLESRPRGWPCDHGRRGRAVPRALPASFPGVGGRRAWLRPESDPRSVGTGKPCGRRPG